MALAGPTAGSERVLTCTLPASSAMSSLPARDITADPAPALPLSKAMGCPCTLPGVPGWEPDLDMGADPGPSEPLSKATGWPCTDLGAA